MPSTIATGADLNDETESDNASEEKISEQLLAITHGGTKSSVRDR